MRKTAYVFGLMIVFALLAGTTAWAQSDPKAEVSFNLGWTFSDGVSGDNFLAPDGNVYDRVDPKDSFSWGVSGEYLLHSGYGVGFMYDRQQSDLEISGTTTRTIGSMAVENYHGYFSFNIGEQDAQVLPFMILGIGMTRYAGVDFTDVAGNARSIPGENKFSAMVGGGVKFYPAPKFGVKLQARWTPTYIKSDSEGYWCDPFWGCYVIGDAQYSNQFEMTGGVCVRF